MSNTDYLRLSEHKIFREVRDSLPKNLSKTLNLLTVYDSVVFAWDFVNNCVLTLNVKAARSREGDNVKHQKLLPLRPPLFTPEMLRANDSGTLLAIAGPSGVLVLELPVRHPPYGAFDHNKDLVYCRSHSLDERLLACSELVEVRQVKFHPASVNDTHILVLTSDNNLRLYQIDNNQAVNLGVFSVGETPGTFFPGSKTPFLEMFGEVAVDFDFAQPEISETCSDLNWPVYILRGDCQLYSISISLGKKCKGVLKGPLPISQGFSGDQVEGRALVCLNTTPQIFCIALSNGTVYHSVVLDMDEESFEELKQSAKTIQEVPKKELLIIESIELELGLSTSIEDSERRYKSEIFLQKDEGKPNRYYATHEAGAHCITIMSTEGMQEFIEEEPEDAIPTEDIFVKPSAVEYLVCTKTASSSKTNPVVGFAMYAEPMSLIALLADGRLVTLGILLTALPKIPEETLKVIQNQSPLKKMLEVPFDVYIQNILQKTQTLPVLKLSDNEQSSEQCYELVQRTSQVLREDYFKKHSRAHDEIAKRINALHMMKSNQLKEIDSLNREKQSLQEQAESLAEKYEDIKDKQDELLRKSEGLLMLVSRKRIKPSKAEEEFIKKLNDANESMTKHVYVIDRVKNKMKYQEVQMANWKMEEVKNVTTMNPMQVNTIRSNLEDVNKSISKMKEKVVKLKKQLSLK